LTVDRPPTDERTAHERGSDMTEDTAPDAASVAADEHDEPEGHPKGALLLGALFVLLMAATWLYAYATLIARS